MDLQIKVRFLEEQIDKLRGIMSNLNYSTWQCMQCRLVVHADQKPTRWCCQRHELEGYFYFCDECIDEYPCSPATSDIDSD